LNFAIILTYFFVSIIESISLSKMYASVMKLVFKLPFIKAKV